MKITVFSARKYDEVTLKAANEKAGSPHELHFLPLRLDSGTAALAHGSQAVCSFVNDAPNAEVLEQLREAGVTAILLRCAGFNSVDLDAAARLNISVLRVPEYSPHAVAEHAVALLLALNRKLITANARVRESNFSLEGLLGFDLYNRTVAVIGTGAIGLVFARIMAGFGCKVVAYDPYPNATLEQSPINGRYVSFDEAISTADVISLHVPLMPSTRHLIDEAAINKFKPGVLLINTARGGLMDTKALVRGLKERRLGGVGLDVIEGEEEMFFEDHSDEYIDNDPFHRLCSFRNVLITGHMAFFTKEALTNIADTTIANASFAASGEPTEKAAPRTVCVHAGKRVV